MDELKRKVALACRVLENEGVADHQGHASARVPGTDNIVIKPIRLPMRLSRGEDMVTIDLDGNKVDGELPPPGETALHTEVYRTRKDVGGISHFHSDGCIALAAAGRELVPLFNTVATFAGGVPVFPDPQLITTAELGGAVAQTLGERRAVILFGHGALVVGSCVEDATVASILLERAARVQLMACAAGEPRGLNTEYAREFANTRGGYKPLWDHYLSRLPGYAEDMK